MTLSTTSPGDEREELSSKQIEAGWHKTFSTSNPFCPCDLKSFTKAVRWAERALSSSTVQQVGAEMKVVAYANPVILLPADEDDPECEWTARVQGNQDDVFSLPLYAARLPAAEPDLQRIPRGEADYALLNKLTALACEAAQANAKANSDDGHEGTEASSRFIELRRQMWALIAPIPKSEQGDQQ